jgi:hypothetical protein
MRERVEEKLSDSEGKDVEELMEKIIESGLKHQKVIDEIEKNFPDMYERLEGIRKNTINNFINSSLEIADPEKVRERLEEKMEEEKGSDFKHIKNLEVLMRVEEEVPQEAKEAIRKAQSNVLRRLEDNLENIPEEEREIFENYMEKVKCNEARCFEVLSELEGSDLSSELRETIEKVKDEVMLRVRERSESLNEEIKGYLEHLEQGQIKKMIIAEEIEGNLPPDLKPYVSEIRQKAKEMFSERLNEAQTEEEREEMLKEAEESANLRSLEFLERIQESMGNNEEFIEQMRERITNRIRTEIESAEGEQKRKEKMEAFSGSSEELLDTLEESGLPSEIKSQLKEATEEKIMNKGERNQAGPFRE